MKTMKMLVFHLNEESEKVSTGQSKTVQWLGKANRLSCHSFSAPLHSYEICQDGLFGSLRYSSSDLGSSAPGRELP